MDSYTGRVKQTNFIDYCLFVLFFPQLIAGPILRYNEITPQFNRSGRGALDWNNIATGCFVFSVGLFKKVIIAEGFSKWASVTIGEDRLIGFIDSWVASLSYTFQLYYDFSGYSDMAIGAALMFNIKLPVNFNSPYLAGSIQEFWRRWHITLSLWLRDYLYIPLGGNRKGPNRALLNIFITFLLGGIWHGAGWTFIVWGALHGGALAVHRIWQKFGLKMNRFWGWLCTFTFINFSWVFFSSADLSDAGVIVQAMSGLKTDRPILDELQLYYQYWPVLDLTLSPLFNAVALYFLIFCSITTFIFPNTMRIINFLPYKGIFKFRTDIKFALCMSVLLALSILSFFGNVSQSDFLYFQF